MSSSDLKDQGNASFKNGEFEKADELYSKAIDLDPTSAPLYRYARVPQAPSRRHNLLTLALALLATAAPPG